MLLMRRNSIIIVEVNLRGGVESGVTVFRKLLVWKNLTTNSIETQQADEIV